MTPSWKNLTRHVFCSSLYCFFCDAKVTKEHVNEHIDNVIVTDADATSYRPVCSSPECQFRRRLYEHVPIRTKIKRLS